MHWNLNPITPRLDARPAWMDGSDNPLAHLSRQLRAAFLAELGAALPVHRIDLAIHEAGAQAMLTPQPELWMPELAREKIAEAHAWFARQQRILGRGGVAFAA